MYRLVVVVAIVVVKPVLLSNYHLALFVGAPTATYPVYRDESGADSGGDTRQEGPGRSAGHR